MTTLPVAQNMNRKFPQKQIMENKHTKRSTNLLVSKKSKLKQ